jgi:hypothetical protein
VSKNDPFHLAQNIYDSYQLDINPKDKQTEIITLGPKCNRRIFYVKTINEIITKFRVLGELAKQNKLTDKDILKFTKRYGFLSMGRLQFFWVQNDYKGMPCNWFDTESRIFSKVYNVWLCLYDQDSINIKTLREMIYIEENQFFLEGNGVNGWLAYSNIKTSNYRATTAEVIELSQTWIFNWLNLQFHINCVCTLRNEKPTLSLIPSDLLSLLYFALLHELTGAIYPPKLCINCSLPFIPKRGNQIYCSQKCKSQRRGRKKYYKKKRKLIS